MSGFCGEGMKEHPGHFSVCFWICVIGYLILLNLYDIKKSIDANTAAIPFQYERGGPTCLSGGTC
jgi:hypothetical protein